MVEAGLDLGKVIWDTEIEKGLRELNPGIHFDVVGRMGEWHPHMATLQGIYYHDMHVGSIGREAVPEYDWYSVIVNESGTKERGAVIKEGWRSAFLGLVNANIPGITWDSLCKKFGIEYKIFVEVPTEETAFYRGA